VITRVLLAAFVANLFSTEARAAGCTSESDGPPVTNASSWRAYQSWCAACGGTVAGSFNAAVAEGGCKLPASDATPDGSASAGHEMDSHIANAISAGVSGNLSGGDATVLVGLGLLGNALLAPSSSNPAQEAAYMEQQAERQRALEAQKAESAYRLGEEMLDTGDSSAGGNESFMADGRPRLQPRNGPRAVLKQPQAKPTSLLEEMMPDPEPVARRTAAPSPRIEAFTLGFNHASGCFSQNAGASCAGAQANEAALCHDEYRAGYQRGDTATKELLTRAFQNGRGDRAAGRPATGGSQPDATGNCRREIIRAYDLGHSGGPPP
jgi:hypothetical protein